MTDRASGRHGGNLVCNLTIDYFSRLSQKNELSATKTNSEKTPAGGGARG